MEWFRVRVTRVTNSGITTKLTKQRKTLKTNKELNRVKSEDRTQARAKVKSLHSLLDEEVGKQCG